MVLAGSGAGAWYWYQKPKLASELWDDTPAFQHPTVHPAKSAPIQDHVQVIGVSAGGRYRAYVLRAMAALDERHVINDMLNDIPVTVSYCPMTQCLAAFEGRQGSAPLEMAMGGYVGTHEWYGVKGSMLLRMGSEWYRQDNGEGFGGSSGKSLPFKRITFEKTTWKEWVKAHPDTDVYVGD
jgi:hypothetical protein